MRGHGDDGSFSSRVALQSLDLGGCLETVHLGHLQIHQNGVEALGAEQIDGLAAVAGQGHGVALLLEQDARQFLVDHVIFGDENAPRARASRQRPTFAGRSGRRDGEWMFGAAETSREMEPAAPAGLTFDPDPATHERHHVSADGKPQAGAAVAPRHGPVGLLEGFKNQLLLFNGDAHAGVLDDDMQQHRTLFRLVGPDTHRDAAALGEFEPIADQVEDDLAQAQRIAFESGRKAWIDAAIERQSARARQRQHGLHGAADTVREFHQGAVEDHLAGLDLGEIERMIQQFQQCLSRLLGGFDVLLQLG